MTRQQALELVEQHLHNPNLVKHCLAVEACMGACAVRLGQDPGFWELAGLLHDLDYEYTVAEPQAHGDKTAAMLADSGLAPAILHAIQAHNLRVEPATPMDHALLAVDPASGFLIACALMHPERRLGALDLPFLQKRFKEKSFAKGASRPQMAGCDKLGLALDEFLSLCLGAVQRIAPRLGL